MIKKFGKSCVGRKRDRTSESSRRQKIKKKGPLTGAWTQEKKKSLGKWPKGA